MACFEIRGSKVRAIIKLKGVRMSKTFKNKTDARAWATAKESEINASNLGEIPANKTFGDLLTRYKEDLDPIAKRSDIIRLNRIITNDAICKIKLRDMDTNHAADWRDSRLRKVSSASVQREWNILSPICKKAVIEWKWLKANPFSGLARPKLPDARVRRISEEELKRIKFVSGYDLYGAGTATSRIAAAFMFAIETAMRIGEIVNLKPKDVHLEEHYLEVTGSAIGARKTKSAKRHVPLTAEAERILKQVDCDFKLKSTQNVDPLWRNKIVKKADIENLHFHDSRHEGITRLAQKLDILDLARTVGIRDLKTLMVYYNPTASELATRLNA